jgi:hypothetical protein
MLLPVFGDRDYIDNLSMFFDIIYCLFLVKFCVKVVRKCFGIDTCVRKLFGTDVLMSNMTSLISLPSFGAKISGWVRLITLYFTLFFVMVM